MFVSQDCRKIFTCCFEWMAPALATTLRPISASVAKAHAGREWSRVRYLFSHIISMASFLDSMSTRPIPPSSKGAYK